MLSVVPERNKGPGTIAHIAKRDAVGSAGRVNGPKCGQCENKGANVTCQECCEDYCAGCFASFHLKGAAMSFYYSAHFIQNILCILV